MEQFKSAGDRVASTDQRHRSASRTGRCFGGKRLLGLPGRARSAGGTLLGGDLFRQRLRMPGCRSQSSAAVLLAQKKRYERTLPLAQLNPGMEGSAPGSENTRMCSFSRRRTREGWSRAQKTETGGHLDRGRISSGRASDRGQQQGYSTPMEGRYVSSSRQRMIVLCLTRRSRRGNGERGLSRRAFVATGVGVGVAAGLGPFAGRDRPGGQSRRPPSRQGRRGDPKVPGRRGDPGGRPSGSSTTSSRIQDSEVPGGSGSTTLHERLNASMETCRSTSHDQHEDEFSHFTFLNPI